MEPKHSNSTNQTTVEGKTTDLVSHSDSADSGLMNAILPVLTGPIDLVEFMCVTVCNYVDVLNIYVRSE